MPGTIFGIPYDEELFLNSWREEPDAVKSALIGSGVVVKDAEIAKLIAPGSDVYTVPFYKTLKGTSQNYDGNADITTSEAEASYASGIVFGRANAWTAKDFVADLSTADPMGFISKSVGRYWNKEDQKELVNILNALAQVTGNAGTISKAFHDTHVYDISSSTATPVIIKPESALLAGVKALGDNASSLAVAFMHSRVAADLAKTQALEYWKYTDAMGIQRNMNIADWNGYVVIIDDAMPHAKTGGSGANKDLERYHTYLLATGFIRTADAPVEMPIETYRDGLKSGGTSGLITRKRQTIHPVGFSYTKPSSGYTKSPTFAQLGNKAQWSAVYDAKTIGFVDIISNVSEID